MVMTLLQRMHQQQIEADAISYTSALNAGSISGRFENGGKRVDFFGSFRGIQKQVGHFQMTIGWKG